MKFILGTKVGMSQIYEDSGKSVPVSLVQVGPVTVTQLKNEEKDGYRAVQVGFGVKKKLNKALKGHVKELDPPGGGFRWLREFRVKDFKVGDKDLKVGAKLEVGIFEEGEKVRVSSVSKGKGFQGVVKRHGFAGGPRTHGQKHSEREGGAIGATGPQRVFKGTKMPGRMGGERITVKNLKVVKIDKANNLITLKGALPGRTGQLLEIVSQ
jgi:large subunit ribosomal protein L3